LETSVSVTVVTRVSNTLSVVYNCIVYRMFQVRPISYEDFVDALQQVRASVSKRDLDVYIDWNKQYGSWHI